MIHAILNFMRSAGDIARTYQRKVSLNDRHRQKESHVGSVVTEADLQVSKLFADFIKQNFSDLDYVIVDEETQNHMPCTDLFGDDRRREIADADYAFIIDPIDGTLPFTLKLPFYAISVGVLKKGKPYLSAVYVPALREIAYFDGKKAFWVTDAFLDNEVTVELLPDQPASSPVILYSKKIIINQNIDLKKETPLDFFAAVFQLFCVATGRAKAYYFSANLWDMAGSWPLLTHLGYAFMNYRTGEVLDVFSPEMFLPSLKIRDYYIVCRPEDFKHMQKIADLRYRG